MNVETWQISFCQSFTEKGQRRKDRKAKSIVKLFALNANVKMALTKLI